MAFTVKEEDDKDKKQGAVANASDDDFDAFAFMGANEAKEEDADPLAPLF